jgi:hypothetical protein
MRAPRSSAVIAALICTAGCGASRVGHHAANSRPVTLAERQAIFNDWYADGQIDDVYRCAVVQDAIRHLPSTPPIGSSIGQDFQRYETRVC